MVVVVGGANGGANGGARSLSIALLITFFGRKNEKSDQLALTFLATKNFILREQQAVTMVALVEVLKLSKSNFSVWMPQS